MKHVVAFQTESEPSFLLVCLSTYLPLCQTFNSAVNTPNIFKLSNILPMQHLTYKLIFVQTAMQTKSELLSVVFALQLYTTGCGCAHYPPFFTLSVYLPCSAAHHATCLFACLSVLFAQWTLLHASSLLLCHLSIISWLSYPTNPLLSGGKLHVCQQQMEKDISEPKSRNELYFIPLKHISRSQNGEVNDLRKPFMTATGSWMPIISGK